MQVLCNIFGSLAGMCTFAFFFAGLIGFYELERPGQNSSAAAKLFQMFFGGWIVIGAIIRHWRTQADLRRLCYYALVSLGAMAVLLYLGDRT